MSLTLKDRIEQFKRELRSYRYYEKSIEEIDASLEELNVKMVGVSSTPPKDVIAGSMSAKVYHSNILELIESKTHLEEEKKYYTSRIAQIDSKLEKIDQHDAAILKDLYVKRVPYDVIADENHYSLRQMKYYVNNVIKSLL